MVIQVCSAGNTGGNLAKIMLNGFQVEMEKNEQDHYRGIHIVIFNPFKGVVHMAQVYDTYKSSFEFNIFVE